MHRILMTKRVWATAASFAVVCTILFMTSYNNYNQADAQIEILASPSLGRSPSPLPPLAVVKLTVAAGVNSPDTGSELAVWNGPAGPIFGPSEGCLGFEPTGAGGIKWQLRADTDSVGATRANFLDAGSAVVGYVVDPGESFTIDFGNGGLATITPTGTVTITPPGVPYAWIDVDGGPVPSPPAGPGTDKTFVVLPAPDTYEFATCGVDSVDDFRAQADFVVDLPATTLTKIANVTMGTAPLPVRYTYTESNTGTINLKDVTVTDIGEDDNNNSSLDAGEDDNNNSSLDLGCTPLVRQSDSPGDNDLILEPTEAWVFQCDTTLTTLGAFHNTAFAAGRVCVDDPFSVASDCDQMPGVANGHTGNPTCVAGSPYPICASSERDDAQVQVTLPSTTTTQSNPSAGDLPPGTVVNDKATVSGSGPTPTGKVKFFLCVPSQVTAGGCVSPAGTQVGTPASGEDLIAGMAISDTVNGSTTPNTNTAGKYCWRAEYQGNANYAPSSHTNNMISVNGGECFQISGPGTIIIIKDTIPNGGQNFEFRHDIESTPDVASPFFLDDDSNGMLPNMKTFSNVPADTYEAREIKDADFPLRDIRCRGDSTFIANGGSTVRDLNNAKVTITINGGTITCTFINGVIPPPCVDGTVSAIQPEDPISMTTVVSKQDTNVIAKTVHAEKQIFDCFTSQDNVPVIADVTIIAEIYENMNTKTTISKQVEVVTCVKSINTKGVDVDCSVMIPSTDAEIVRFCGESPIEEPQEMNTVAKASVNGGTNGKGVTKTIEAQKEVFLCDLDNADQDNNPLTHPEKKVDLITFTETWEDLSLLPGNPTLPRPPIETLRCVIKIDTVTVEACQFREFPL